MICLVVNVRRSCESESSKRSRPGKHSCAIGYLLLPHGRVYDVAHMPPWHRQHQTKRQGSIVGGREMSAMIGNILILQIVLSIVLASGVSSAPDIQITDLGTLGGTSSRATAVNDLGQVVGWGDTASGEPHAFSWTAAGGMVDLGTLGGNYSTAAAVNDLGQVVGYSFKCLLT